jgi:hypothetical protein
VVKAKIVTLLYFLKYKLRYLFKKKNYKTREIRVYYKIPSPLPEKKNGFILGGWGKFFKLPLKNFELFLKRSRYVMVHLYVFL